MQRILARVRRDCYSVARMSDKDRSESLKIGDRAPDFSLTAANRDGTFSLTAVLQRGPAIVEFLRGTW